ncbi:MAG: class II aldolase/adducin family protein [Bryobacterales bacterium]|nr:class II aldolase/adducin family protein [Bryobacterales bacterium]
MNVLEQLCDSANSFFARGLAFGSTGNLSLRMEDSVWITPTGCQLRGLTPDKLAEISLDGTPRNSNRASKEYPFHTGLYRVRPEARAIVHLHSTYSVALSCLDTLDPARPMPAMTPYFFMRVAPLGIVPYFRPGSQALADAVVEAARTHHSLLLRNHGLVTSGATWNEAVDRAEELEETARLHFLLRGEQIRELTPADLAELAAAFKA